VLLQGTQIPSPGPPSEAYVPHKVACPIRDPQRSWLAKVENEAMPRTLDGLANDVAMARSVSRIQSTFRRNLMPPDEQTLRNRVHIFKAGQQASAHAAAHARGSVVSGGRQSTSIQRSSLLNRLTLMRHAIKAGNADALRLLLADNNSESNGELDSVRMHDEEGERLLCLALRYERVEMALMLLAAGANFGDAAAWLGAMVDSESVALREALIVSGGFFLDEQLIKAGCVNDPAHGIRWREVEGAPAHGDEFMNEKLRRALFERVAGKGEAKANRVLGRANSNLLNSTPAWRGEKVEFEKSDLDKYGVGARFGGSQRPRLGSYIKVANCGGRDRFFELDDEGPINKVRLSSRHRVLELLCDLDEAELGVAAARAARLQKPTRLLLTTIQAAVSVRYRARQFKVTWPSECDKLIALSNRLELIAAAQLDLVVETAGERAVQSSGRRAFHMSQQEGDQTDCH